MTALAERLRDKYFRNEDYPYRVFEREVDRHLEPGHTLLDAGAGRTAPILVRYRGRASRLIGVDLVDFDDTVEGVELYKCDLGRMPLADSSVDLIMARSVMEHVEDPATVFAEVSRVLKPGGRMIFITASLWDYAAIIAKVIPNRFHPWIVSKTEGREEHDVFPVVYRTNTRGAVRRWARGAGLEVESFRYLGQYPSYFMFNGFLFLLATGYEKIIDGVPALNFLQGWIFAVLRKPTGAASA